MKKGAAHRKACYTLLYIGKGNHHDAVIALFRILEKPRQALTSSAHSSLAP